MLLYVSGIVKTAEQQRAPARDRQELLLGKEVVRTETHDAAEQLRRAVCAQSGKQDPKIIFVMPQRLTQELCTYAWWWIPPRCLLEKLKMC